MSDDRVNELERALRSGESSDPEIDDLARLGRDLRHELEVDVRPAPGARALFVTGVAERGHHSRWPSLFAPALAGVALALIGLLGFLSRTATPGQALHPIRDLIEGAGLVEDPSDVVDRRISSAEAALERAEDALSDDRYGRAKTQALAALAALEAASEPLDELTAEQREDRADEIADLRADATDVYNDAEEERVEEALEAIESEDNSGPGSDDDNSGPGSDDDGGDDDNSGPGSDDDGDDDNSGSGSDDDGDDDSGRGRGRGRGGEDSSGSGSDDSSGSDSDDSSGSGSDDSSGSGSGGSGSDDD